MTRLKVKYVGVDQETGHPLVLLSDLDEVRFLPIVVGPYEAGAILASLEQRSFQRPLTHDLLLNVIHGLKGQVSKVLIADLEEGTFFARLCVQSLEGEVEIDARPSDAIAIALRAEAPVYVSDKVRREAMIPADRIQGVEGADAEKEEFLRFLENISPEDFRNALDD